MIRQVFKVSVILLIFTIALPIASQNIYNPFQNKYRNSLLDYNRFRVYNQISLFAMHNSFQGNYSGGFHLTSLQYNISPSVTSYFHIGKTYSFSSDNNFAVNSSKNILSGATLLYKINSDLNIGMEYGATPEFLNAFYGFVPDNYLHLWLNKKFGDNINIQVEYYQIK